MKKITHKKQLALITGGSSGMGLEFARQLAGCGYDLLIVSNREEELADSKIELEKRGAKVCIRFQDLAKSDAAEQLFLWCQSENIYPDLLVNNAGMFFFKELTPNEMHRSKTMLNLHIHTVTNLCILFGNKMKECGKGHIINISSMAARLPYPGITVYAASKAYLRSFGKSYYYELRPYGVILTTVCPAAIATPLYNLSEKWMKIGLNFGVIHKAEWLVRRSLRAAFNGRRIVSPSFMNIYLPPLLAMLPKCLVAHIWKQLKKQ